MIGTLLQILQSLFLQHFLELIHLFLVDNSWQTHIRVLIVPREEQRGVSEELLVWGDVIIYELLQHAN